MMKSSKHFLKALIDILQKEVDSKYLGFNYENYYYKISMSAFDLKKNINTFLKLEIRIVFSL